MSQSQPSPHARKRAPLLVAALIVAIFTLALLEIVLRAADPWGINSLTDTNTLVDRVFVTDPVRGYAMRDGTYQFSNWTATIRSGARVVPATPDTAACTIALLGDSVTFGLGVNDDQTWANQLAIRLPDVRFINGGVAQYNSGNVLGTLQSFPDADAYLYLILYNDVNPEINMATQRFTGARSGELMLIRYTNFAIRRGDNSDPPVFADPDALLPDSPDLTRFIGELHAITREEPVTLAAFGGEPLTNAIIASGFTVNVLPPYPADYRSSYAADHLNARGNEALADMIQPIIEGMVAEQCASAD